MPETKPASRLAFVDGLRALSALWVIAYDVWRFNRDPDLGPLTALFRSGHLGVEVFMVLSGFCLFYPIAEKRLAPGHWRDYFVRRARRILPPYYAAMAYAIALPFLVIPLFWAMRVPYTPGPLPSAWQFVTHLSLVHNLFPDTQSGINPSFWSLSLEAQFYVIFPLLALLLLRLRGGGLAAIVGFCLVYRFLAWQVLGPLVPDASRMALGAILGRLTIFTAGMGAAWLVRNAWRPRLSRLAQGFWVLSTPLVMALGFYWYFHPVGAWPLSDACLGVAIGGLLVRSASGTSWLATPWLVALGERSYSFYLINRPTCYFVNYAIVQRVPGTPALHMGLTLAVGGTISVLLAMAFYRWIERPFMVRRPQPTLAKTTAMAR
ncbi:MAG TPA: acyltransferase [Stenomitos sp.]